MNVSLNENFEQFIDGLVASGQYNSSSEVVREALRLLQRKKTVEQQEIEYYRREIKKGLDSGEAKPWDKDKFLAEAHKRFEEAGHKV